MSLKTSKREFFNKAIKYITSKHANQCVPSANITDNVINKVQDFDIEHLTTSKNTSIADLKVISLTNKRVYDTRDMDIAVLIELHLQTLDGFVIDLKHDALLWSKKYMRLADCRKKGLRFIVIPLKIINYPKTLHLNALIFDIKNNTLERFEPHGSRVYGEDDQIINTILSKLHPEFTYIEPTNFCLSKKYITKSLQKTLGSKTGIGMQAVQEFENIASKANLGYCQAWSFWFIDLRLQNPDKTPQELIDIAIKDVKTGAKTYTTFIQDFIKKINKIK